MRIMRFLIMIILIVVLIAFSLYYGIIIPMIFGAELLALFELFY